ncbi:hypothetical protein ACP6L2_03200 [Sphingobacterium lactis]|uniref:hypothetical protein n=1 Tax=Sphingobacterium lactis TaxID=797291 RepID=UPI003F7E71EA
MKNLLFVFILATLFSCQQSSHKTEKVHQDSTSATTAKTDACNWMKKNVEGYFNSDDQSIMETMTTADYFDYKMDAINLDLDVDGSLSEDEFKKKWSSKFNTDYAGKGVGFLISAQDWGSIQVSTCDVIHEDASSITLKSIISDCEFQTDYHREITLLKENNSFKIKDVKEFD